ncbi:MAG TPA: radical SAM family heme chaperone HemW [Chthoniobacterales bacterium]|nr:radical SAM family heme chaperone HemW [Chthoniobacterales bacterium]
MVERMVERANDNCIGDGPLRHIYVHIPFCARICPYCAFYKERADPAQTGRFCEAIRAELAEQAARFQIESTTIFFGGGTPTALTTAQIALLLDGFATELDLSRMQEWTFEANPGSVSERKALLLRERGVTRISLGVQSFDDGLLQLLGREHSASQAVASFELLRRAGFENLNVDLMFGLPGQTLAQWKQTLQEAVALQPDHVSAYCLTYEEDTEFFLRHARGEFRDDEEADAAFFETTVEVLGNAGLAQYEVSNFARAGFESQHNQAYWRGENYLGLGPSAVSTVRLLRWQNVCDYRTFADRILAGERAATGEEILTPTMKRTEAIALGLRTRNGVPANWLTDWPNEIAEFVDLGLMQRDDRRVVLTRSGRLLADSVAEAFV